MKIENHLEKLKENLKVIEESIERGLVERQQTIGFHTSAACANMLEIYLHKLDLIDTGFIVKHDWFNSKNILKEKFPFDFPRKEKIIELISKIEGKRNLLCYGKPQEIKIIQEILDDFNALREILMRDKDDGK